MQSVKHIPELKTSSVELIKDCQPRPAGEVVNKLGSWVRNVMPRGHFMMRSKILSSHSNAQKKINELLGQACECYQA